LTEDICISLNADNITDYKGGLLI